MTRMLRRLAALALALVLAACAAPAPPAAAPARLPFQVEVVNEGELDLMTRVAGLEGAWQPAAPALRAREGLAFGFSVLLKGVPDGSLTDFQVRALHPPMARPEGGTKTETLGDATLFGIDGSAPYEVVFIMEEAREVVRGRWTLQLLYQGRVVAARDFLLQ